MLRIQLGKLKNKKLNFDQKTRPTESKIVLSIYNSLINSDFVFDGISVLDLYSGSGVLGLTAISLGAAELVSIDTSNYNIKQINLFSKQNNLNGISAYQKQIDLDNIETIFKLINKKEFNLIFADPPYTITDYSKIFKTYINLLQYKGRLIIRLDKNSDISELLSYLDNSALFYKIYQYSNTRVLIIIK